MNDLLDIDDVAARWKVKRDYAQRYLVKLPEPIKTGWPPSELMQDDCRDLSKWLSNRIDSRRHAREAAAAIRAQPEPTK